MQIMRPSLSRFDDDEDDDDDDDDDDGGGGGGGVQCHQKFN